MRFMHTKCGGEINVKKRRCTKCGKKWSQVSFRLDLTGIRPMVDGMGRLMPGGVEVNKLKKKYIPGVTKSYAGWGDKIPGLSAFASKLPKWPRWARVSATVAFIAAVVVIVLVIRR